MKTRARNDDTRKDRDAQTGRVCQNGGWRRRLTSVVRGHPRSLHANKARPHERMKSEKCIAKNVKQLSRIQPCRGPRTGSGNPRHRTQRRRIFAALARCATSGRSMQRRGHRNNAQTPLIQRVARNVAGRDETCARTGKPARPVACEGQACSGGISGYASSARRRLKSTRYAKTSRNETRDDGLRTGLEICGSFRDARLRAEPGNDDEFFARDYESRMGF